MAEEFVQGFIADDSRSLEDILTKEYGLQELKSFFGEIPPNESVGYELSENKAGLTINYVNENFPIECLRLNHYVVYKVSEGGYFYVFWSLFIDQTSEESGHSVEDVDNAMVYFTAYLYPSSMKRASDFDSIKEGVSTAEDVSRVDPAFELSFLVSSGTRSYSLLEDGSVMEIWYKRSLRVESRRDLVVERKEIGPRKRGTVTSGGMAAVLLKDLP